MYEPGPNPPLSLPDPASPETFGWVAINNGLRVSTMLNVFQDNANDLSVVLNTEKLYPVTHSITGDFTASSDPRLVSATSEIV